MNHHCPRCEPKTLLIWQPAKLRYYCARCRLNFTPRAVCVIEGGLPVIAAAAVSPLDDKVVA